MLMTFAYLKNEHWMASMLFPLHSSAHARNVGGRVSWSNKMGWIKMAPCTVRVSLKAAKQWL